MPPRDAGSAPYLGEAVTLRERLVIAPTPGRIALPGAAGRPARGWFVQDGETLARVHTATGDVPVRSRFDGWVMGFLVADGQPVSAGSPVVWLREE